MIQAGWQQLQLNRSKGAMSASHKGAPATNILFLVLQ